MLCKICLIIVPKLFWLCEISYREAHFWYVIPDEVKGTSLLEQYLEILSPSEKQAVLSLKEDELRKRAILTRTLVRATIARCRSFLWVLFLVVSFVLVGCQFSFIACPF